MGMVHKGGNAVPFHGDHHPVKLSTHRKSKNLLQTGITPSKTTEGVTYTRNDDGSVTVNGAATGTAYFNLDFAGNIDSAVNYWTGYIDREITVSGGNYGVGLTCGLFTEDGHIENICSSEYGNATTATVPGDAYMMRSYLLVRKGTTVDNVTIYPQVELGSTATEYEPYGLIEEPIFEPIDKAQDGKTLTFENTYNDTAEVTVFGESVQETLTGKNLLDSDNAGVWGDVNTWGDVIKNENSFVLTSGKKGSTLYFYKNITFIGGQSYTVSFDASSSVDNLIFGYNYLMSPNGGSLNYPLRKSVVLTRETQHLSFKFTAPTDYGESFYSKFMLGSEKSSSGDTITLSNIQLEAGDTATEYEPYCGGIPSPNPDYPQPIESIKSVELVSSNADGSKSAMRTIDLQGHELRSLPDGTRDEMLVHRDGTVELVLRCDASMFDPSYPVSNEWKLATPQTIQLPSIDPLPTYHPYTFVDGNGADISAHVRVFLGPTSKIIDGGGK